ncbi:putative glutathione S transferase [Hypoxylon trugodes]|uniref:putative glutathione S transferase n=1 Tax=Hypoxylon trugodes TaxID=326681 RepID=UPI0021935C90|nr:putative glutathione S transferase [Hypoxylon trugodes]KAI1387799.1 putative glutathione S transferase [Hypoxylon trugodes]
MADGKLNQGNTLYVYFTRYSSWGSRVELLISYFQIPCDVRMYGLNNPAAAPPSRFVGGLLPALQPDPEDEDFIISDSLAICEFLAEQNPELNLWPKDPKLRALARAAVAKMHSGFSELRNTYHTNFFGKYTGQVPLTDAGAKEARSMVEIWSKARADTKKRLQELGEEDGGFLFGKFSIADTFFWPVLWRFRSYQLPLTGISEDGLKWMAKMWSDPVVKKQIQEYSKQAQNPLTRIEKYEDIFKGNPNVKYSQFTEDWSFEPSV